MLEYQVGKLNGRWVVWWWEDGKRRRFRLEASTLGDAKREALDRRAKETIKPETATVQNIWDAYLSEKKGRPIIVTMEHNWKALAPHFGHLRPDQITVETCRAYQKARLAAQSRNGGLIKTGTVWTELGHLRMVLVWAVPRKFATIAPEIERPQKPAPKERHLTRAECERLIQGATQPHIRLAIILMLSTAARVGAVLDLTWSRVDFERRQIKLRRDDMETRKGRATVPINAGLMAALQDAKEKNISDYVVEWAGQQVKSIRTGFDAAVKAAELPGVSPHVLRHTAAVHLAEAGTPMAEIAQYLGHNDSKITARVYARYSPEHLRESAKVLDFTTVRQVR